MNETPKKPYRSILIIHSNAVSDFRVDLAARHLERAGYETETVSEVPYYKAGQFDAILCCRPGGALGKDNPGMISFLRVALDAGKPVIVDLDDDFYAIPRNNPAFGYMGAGSPTFLNELDHILKHEGVIVTYASKELETRYRTPGIVIPNCWDEENPNWLSKKPKRKTINIGFSGTRTHRDDFRVVEPTLKKLLAENNKLKMVVSVDDTIYRCFSDVPEGQKVFIPGISYKDYPLVFQYIDILVVPLKDTRFNRAKSDIKNLEAGASRTPWVASNIPVYAEWGVGGLIVKGDDWETPLRSLIDDAELRKEYGDSGHLKAMTRTSEVIGRMWVELFGRVLNV